MMNMSPQTYPHLDQMQPWNDRLHLLECLSVIEEAPNVKTFTFRSDNQNWFRYEPGQFMTFELPVQPEAVLRTFTLSSSPSRPFTIAVTAKAQDGSIGARWMLDHLTPGARLKAFGPLGDFSMRKHPGDKYLFISAGSGITPMMSMTRWMHDCAPQSDINFVTCARRPSDIIFRRELEYLTSCMPNLKLAFLIKEHEMGQVWTGIRGRFEEARLPLLSPDFKDRTIFCCGPESFMRDVRTMLEASGFDMRHYHQESFGPAAEPVLPMMDAISTEAVERSAMVSFSMSGMEVPCAPGETILKAARGAGIRIAAACESGLCGTCKVMKISGEVDMDHNGGILDDEIDEGYVLACCSKPLGNVEIEA
jgi:glycine betaine catabolism B